MNVFVATHRLPVVSMVFDQAGNGTDSILAGAGLPLAASWAGVYSTAPVV